MTQERTQILSISSGERAAFEALSRASGSGWWRVGKADIPPFVPATMVPKLDGGVIVLSGSASGTTIVMFGADRIDQPVDMRDIHPFGMGVFPSGSSDGMAIIHHGGWLERSKPLPDDFWKIANSCNTASYFFSNPPEGATSGTLDQLGTGYRLAFEKIASVFSGSSGSAA